MGTCQYFCLPGFPVVNCQTEKIRFITWNFLCPVANVFSIRRIDRPAIPGLVTLGNIYSFSTGNRYNKQVCIGRGLRIFNMLRNKAKLFTVRRKVITNSTTQHESRGDIFTRSYIRISLFINIIDNNMRNFPSSISCPVTEK